MLSVLKKIIGTSNERYLKTLQPIVAQINTLEASFEKLSDAQLREKTIEFKNRYQQGESLDSLLPEAFAAVREASKRTLGKRHYDVQLVGGIVLHQGKIAEMKTGEGKTLVATLATYLNALSDKGVHVVTANDYLASRDAEWMGQIYKFLGMTVGCVVPNQDQEEKRQAYQSDITYGTNNEFGFDYLRDNMKYSIEQMAQRPFNFAIVDEVDSILVDEARTPLIISGPVEQNIELYRKVNQLMKGLKPEDYELDEKARQVSLIDAGINKIEDLLRSHQIISEESHLYDLENIHVLHHVEQSLKAHTLFQRDKDYIVKDDKIIIIDEFTGRMMDGRRYSEGLHQAIEAKENVTVQNENQTLASITFQNYFRQYPKLAGMTGTASTEAPEFSDIYNLSVVEIPTNRTVQRVDDNDSIYRFKSEKYEAILKLISDCVSRNQPVLIGTASIEKSEEISDLLKKKKIPHNVLNARHHDKEAEIIAQAGRPGRVTVATNMAGRGTDIQLGGNEEMLIHQAILALAPEKQNDEKAIAAATQKVKKQIEEEREIVIKAGGLCVIGTERHESRRIDNQLRGRSGRQGDPGYSKFYLSADDDIFRIFGADKKIDWILGTMGTPGESIDHPLLNKVMSKSQQKVEARNYEIRKNLLKFDDVMNDQRKVIYKQRIEIMKSEDISETVKIFFRDVTENLANIYISEHLSHDDWQIEDFDKEFFRIFGIHAPISEYLKEDGIDGKEIIERLISKIEKAYSAKEAKYHPSVLRDLERKILLYTLDELWKEHLYSIDNLRRGIYLRAYGQKDPLNEYKRESFIAFEGMLQSLKEKFCNSLLHAEIHASDEAEQLLRNRLDDQKISTIKQDLDGFGEEKSSEKTAPKVRIVKAGTQEKPVANDPETWGKIGRNEACPCGSGKKFKQCHGAL